MLKNRALRIVAALIVIGTSWLSAPSIAVAAGVPNPIVEGPIGTAGIHARPWNSSLYDITPYGYTEQEYFFSGVARTLEAEAGVNAPYKTRMIVKRPVSDEQFNGTVIVEWLNVTGAADLETVWPPAWKYLVNHGYAYVGVSAQLVGICCGPNSLKGWDPARYATLAHPGDDYSFDIFSQALKALRDPLNNRTTIASPQVVDPMGGLHVRYLVAGGASQSASRLTSYINKGYSAQAHGLIDAYNITRGGGPYSDFSVPIFQLNEEGQPERPADTNSYRLWEEAGTAHAPQAWWNYIWSMQMRDNNVPTAPNAVNMACSVNRGSVDYSSDAFIAATQLYLESDGTILPPSAPRIRRANGSVVRDADGLAVGGLRHPFVQVPVSLNQASGCPLYGYYRSWPAEKIRARYATHEAYVNAVKSWADYEVAARFLVPEDRTDVIAKAQAFTGPWESSCYDTYNASGNENGPLSSQTHTISNDPTLPVGAGSAARDISCNVIAPAGL